MIAEQLTARLRAAAEYMTLVGWTRDAELADDASVSVFGAVLHCGPKDGDEELVTRLLLERNRVAGFDLMTSFDEEEAFVFLSETEITESELEALFGADWNAIVYTIRATAQLGYEPRYQAMTKALMNFCRQRVTRVIREFTAADLLSRSLATA